MMRVSVCLLFLLHAVSVSAQDEETHTVPGEAAWLGTGEMVDDAPVEFESYLPLLYVIMGSGAVAIPRVIIQPTQECPELVLLPLASANSNTASARQAGTDLKIPEVTVRGVGDMELPHAFPIKICEARLKTLQEKEAWSSGRLFFQGLEDRDPIKIPTNPQKVALIADTGLRVKANNLGLGKCDGNHLYGVAQCEGNFTASDLDEIAEGSFQSLDDWPLPDLMAHAAATNPDLVAFMGDYVYRQSPCPANNTVNADCADINMPANFAHTDIPLGTIINFIPGHWGDNWFGWWADFFYPSLSLLQSVPFIAVRGNHENCARAGYGYFFLMSDVPYEGTEGGKWCLDYVPPFAVPFENEQFLVMDDSIISPENGGIDHMNFTEGACPGPPSDGSVLVPDVANRNDDPDQTASDIEPQLSNFTKFMSDIKALSQSHDTNFYLSHRPLFAVACTGNKMATLDWTMQQSLEKDTLDRVVAMITGHMHWLEALSFVDQSLPAQMVVGHGGTDRIPNYVDQAVFPSLQLEVGPIQPDGSPLLTGRVEKGMTDSRMYGFAIMERSADSSDYNVKFLSLNHTVQNNTDVRELVELEFQLDIPKGPRVGASSSDGGEAGSEVESSSDGGEAGSEVERSSTLAPKEATETSDSGSTVAPVGEATAGSDPTVTSSGSQWPGGLPGALMLAVCLVLPMISLLMS